MINKIILFLILIIFNWSVYATDTDNAEVAKEGEDNSIEVIRKEIGKVLKVKKGKSFGDGVKLRKKNVVESGVVYSTLAGGVLHLMLDSKTRIFIGNESEIIIKKFDVIDDKVHEVEIDLVSGSFYYLSLRKTSTDLKVTIDDEVLNSKGTETGVAFLKKEKEIRFVNAGKSTLNFKDELISFSEYGILDSSSNSLSINSIPNATDDNLVGTALEDYSMTVKGKSTSGSSGGGVEESSAGGCG